MARRPWPRTSRPTGQLASNIAGWFSQPSSRPPGRGKHIPALSGPAAVLLRGALQRACDDGADQADENRGEDCGQHTVNLEARQEVRRQPETEPGHDEIE